MHHLSELEDLASRSTSEPDELEKEDRATRCEHLHVLVDFLRPSFRKWCVPALERLSDVPPTVTFDDIWFLMKPGSMAYAIWDDHWIGCIIEKTKRLPAEPDDVESWSVKVRFLQVHWASDEIGFASFPIIIDKFDGERLVTNLPVFPCEFHDRQDDGARKDSFQKRGDRICELFWGGSRYLSYEGELMDDARPRVRPPLKTDRGLNQ
jgi:hypothetical protein